MHTSDELLLQISIFPILIMNSRRQITVFFVTLGIVIGSIFLLNYCMDISGNRTMSQVSRLSMKQKDGEIIIAEKAFDQRSWVKGILEQKRNCPRVLIMGSSTIGSISQQMMRVKTLNAWLTGPTIEDYEALYSILEKNACMPEKIIIGIDPWFLNKRMVSDRWKTWMSKYQEYHHQKENMQRQENSWVRAWAQFKDRLSFITTVESFKFLVKSKSIQTDRVELFEGTTQDLCKSEYLAKSYTDAGANVYFRETDGHSEVCPQFSRAKEEVRKISETYLSRNMHNVADWHEVNMDALTRFGTLVKKFRAQNSKVLIVMPPFNPITYSVLQKNSLIRDNLQKMNDGLEEISKRYGAGFLNLEEASVAHCKDEDFEDSHHGNQVCVEHVASVLFDYLQNH